MPTNDVEDVLDPFEIADDWFANDPVPLAYVERRAPFVAREMRRQGMLRTTGDGHRFVRNTCTARKTGDGVSRVGSRRVGPWE
jgi:hypothetical protein